MSKRNIKESLALSLRGILMGAADVVPGVSGGTIAFITGIYQELLDSISAINLDSLKLLLKGKFKEFWKAINGGFFVFLLAGVFISILTLASFISEIVASPKETKEKVLLWSFFFGLITASVIYVAKQIQSWDIKKVISLIIGAAIAYYITIASPAAGSDSPLYIFLAGFVAICAMILPGISGSFILLLMGAYPIVLGSIKGLIDALKDGASDLIINNGITLGIFAVGCIIGLLSFARLVSYLFKKAPELTLAVLTGFLIGSLNKVWPWKQTIEMRINSDGEKIPYIQENLSPNSFAELNSESHLVLAIMMMVIGFGLVFLIEWLGGKMAKED